MILVCTFVKIERPYSHFKQYNKEAAAVMLNNEAEFNTVENT